MPEVLRSLHATDHAGSRYYWTRVGLGRVAANAGIRVCVLGWYLTNWPGLRAIALTPYIPTVVIELIERILRQHLKLEYVVQGEQYTK